MKTFVTFMFLVFLFHTLGNLYDIFIKKTKIDIVVSFIINMILVSWTGYLLYWN